MTPDVLHNCITAIRDSITDMGSDVEEIIIHLSTGEKVHIKSEDFVGEDKEPFLSFCEFNLNHNPELWYHTIWGKKQGTRFISAEHIVIIDVIYHEEDNV